MAKKNQEVTATELPKVVENKVKFLVWFSGVVHHVDGVKPHHMNSIRSFFDSCGLGGEETEAAYNEGLRKFGF